MDLNSSQGTQSTQLSINNEDFQRNLNSDYDQKINQFTFQQIEVYLQNHVKYIFLH